MNIPRESEMEVPIHIHRYIHSCKIEINDQSFEEEVLDAACRIATENIISSGLHVHEPVG